MQLVQSAFEEVWNKVEMEREGIYCFRWSCVSESDYGVKALNVSGLAWLPGSSEAGHWEVRISL